MPEWIGPIIQLASLGVLTRAAYILGNIRGQMENVVERLEKAEEKLDASEIKINGLAWDIGRMRDASVQRR